MSSTTASRVEDVEKKAAEHLIHYTREMTRAKSLFTGLDAFHHQPTDIFITSFLKSGTTLTQQLVYQLLCSLGRVPNDPTGTNFVNISHVVPTIELRHAFALHQPVHQLTPRAWKSHGYQSDFAFVPKSEGKFIYLVRNGLHVARSYFDFTLDWIIYEPHVQGAELRAELYRQFFLFYFLGLKRKERGDGGVGYEREEGVIGEWFAHVKSWIDSDREVYFLIYEDLTNDMERCAREVARHLGVEHDVSAEMIALVIARCDRAAMAADPRFLDTMVTDALGWNMNEGIRVRPEGAPGFKDVVLPHECLLLYEEMLEGVFGVGKYEEIAGMLRARNAELLMGKKR